MDRSRSLFGVWSLGFGVLVELLIEAKKGTQIIMIVMVGYDLFCYARS